MYLAVFNTFAASKSEPLATVLERVHAAFIAAGLGDPSVRFTLHDHAEITNPAVVSEIGGMKHVSSVARVLTRFPELERFARDTPSGTSGRAAARTLSNLTPVRAVEPVAFATLLEIARGVPKSFPFRSATFHFAAPGFSDGPELPPVLDPIALSQLLRAGVDIGTGHPTTAGVAVRDAWWVNGRQRTMAALRIVEADPAAKRLPEPPAAVAAVLAACGKVRKTTQLPIVVGPAERTPAEPDKPEAAAADAIRSTVRSWRARLPELLDTLPHDLPHQDDTPVEPGDQVASGPKKPALVEAFGPLGYDCRGAAGLFAIRRRTTGNLTVELELDVGTWSNSLMATFRVIGMLDGHGFKATLGLPVSRRAVHDGASRAQFPIGGPERWRRIVDNLAALVTQLDGGFVPEIEAAAGPSPEWFSPADA